MAIRTYKVTLDSKNSIAPEPVYLRQGDKTGAVVIDATLMDNGSPVSLDGLTPMFKANTADGQAVIADSTGFNVLDSANGEFTYQVPNALSSVPGKITIAYFSLSDADGSESTFDVAFIIKAAVDISKTQADDYITIIDGTLHSLRYQMDGLKVDLKTIIDNYNSGNFYTKPETDSKDNVVLSSSKAYTDSSIHGIVSLPETFANLAAIQSKYPNGANGVMVAADSGHKYIWANSTWTDAGVYQAVGIADKSIDWNKLKVPLTRGYIILGKITIKGGTISFSKNLALDYNNGFLYPNKETALTIPDDGNPIYVSANRDTKEYSVTLSSQVGSLTNADVMIGILYLRRFFVYGQHSQEFVEYNEETYKPARTTGSIVLGELNVDYENNTITHDSGDLIVASLGMMYRTSNRLTAKIPVDSDTKIVYVFYDFAQEKLECVTAADMFNRSHIYLFALYQGVIYGAGKAHINFVNRNRLEDREPETSVILFSNAYKIIVNETEDKGEVIIPAGSCFYINTGGRYLRFVNELKVEYTPQTSDNTAALLTFFYNNGNVYADYFRHKYDDVRLFSVYGGKIYGSSVSGYIVNDIDDGGWGSASAKPKLNLMDWYQKAKNAAPANVIWLGDSTWEGYRVVDKNNVFPVYLNSLLPNEFSGVTSFNCSKGGYSTKQLYNSFDTLTANATNVGLLMIGGGLNDYANIADSKKYLDLLVQKARDNSWTPVIVTTQATALLYADTAVGGDWTRTQTDFAKINKMKRQYAHDNDIDLLDFEKYTHDFIEKSPTLMSEMFTDYLHGQDPIHIFEANVAMAYLSQPADVIFADQLVGITTTNARSDVSYNLAYAPLATMEDGFKIKYAFTAVGDEVLLDYQFLITADGSSWSLNGFNGGVPVKVTVDGTDYMLSVDGQICELPIGYHHVVAKATAGMVAFKGLKIKKDDR